MAAIRNILYSMLLGMTIVSCSTSDDMSDEQGMEQPTAKQVDLNSQTGRPADEYWRQGHEASSDLCQHP